MAALDLRRYGRDFAQQLSGLLNKTVCDGIRITTVHTDGPVRAVLGYKITEQSQDPTVGIPVRLGRGKASCYIGLSYRLGPDDHGTHPMVVSSFIGLFADQALDQPLLHYDYERGKEDGYPEAHLQISAVSEGWKALCAKVSDDHTLDKLHLPVGGRRYRPSLEDLVEFLVTEKFAKARDGWEDVVREGRKDFQARQLRAAVRRDPEAALEVLRGLKLV